MAPPAPPPGLTLLGGNVIWPENIRRGVRGRGKGASKGQGCLLCDIHIQGLMRPSRARPKPLFWRQYRAPRAQCACALESREPYGPGRIPHRSFKRYIRNFRSCARHTHDSRSRSPSTDGTHAHGTKLDRSTHNPPWSTITRDSPAVYITWSSHAARESTRTVLGVTTWHISILSTGLDGPTSSHATALKRDVLHACTSIVSILVAMVFGPRASADSTACGRRMRVQHAGA